MTPPSTPIEMIYSTFNRRADTYDLVFYQAGLEYFCETDERMRVWQEMTRVTKIGGWVAAILQHTAH